jgi:5-methylcytosine-specific restriction endonuclease McrA
VPSAAQPAPNAGPNAAGVSARNEGNLKALYQTARWRRVRRAFLRMHPRCEAATHVAACDGLATVVDHIVPRRLGGSTWSRTNWQSLSKPCHDAKTRREQGWKPGAADRPAIIAPVQRAPSRIVVADYTAKAGR